MTQACTLPGRPESARAARDFTAACLSGCPSVYEAMVCADELVTNAIQHSRSGLPGGTVTVRVITQPGQWFRVEVEDAGPRLRAVPDDPGGPGSLAEHGRGLALVEVLADAAGRAAGLAWFVMAWHSEASVPEPRPPAQTAAELRVRVVLDRSAGMCQCTGQCGRAGHRCAIGDAPGHPLYVVAADPATGDAAAARLPAADLVALCAACRAGRDRIAAHARAAAEPEPEHLFGLAVKP
jgi:Histidine kinase-like ATPase domain